MSTEPTPSLGSLLKASTSDATLRELLRVPLTTETQDASQMPFDRPPRSPRTPGEEETLEWHEVIELQAFSERKAWIEEKIKFLEQLPPIQVFVGLDAIRASDLDVPGLPTREQLREWMEEHDRIEKDTEIFDSGELKKLKKFTKAAAQRNLSPADTDLIELTLTTMYSFDKLVHLLRDRSDNLELLGIRLTWEERRKTGWTELRSLVADLSRFLETRARWSPAVYERNEDEDVESPTTDRLALPPPTLRRRGSTISLASAASDASIPSLGISRGERFKLAESLSRDAAQLASRVSSLRHSKITAAGKALDRLIDESRRPVPDELLDEQDKLEDKGINAMEDIGKFVMNVVMQWKKADEIYVETVKDKNAAETLLEEVEIAKLHHPTSRQNSLFLSRLAGLTKRLDMRGNPALASSHFPRPLHPISPDQNDANQQIVETLASELDSARAHVREVEVAVKEYQSMFDAVKKVDTLAETAEEMINGLELLILRLKTGTDDSAGDGSAPNLSSEACLQQSNYTVYLAHLPDLVQQLQDTALKADKLLLAARRALADLHYSGIDAGFVARSTEVFDRLAILCTSARTTCDEALSQADTLKKVRRIWSTMAEVFDRVNAIRDDLRDAIQKGTWKSDSDVNAALLTPESPASGLPSPVEPPLDAAEQLNALTWTFDNDVVSPLGTLSPSLGPPLRGYLDECVRSLRACIEDARRMANLCAAVDRQSSEMEGVRGETQRLQLQIDELKTRCESLAQDVLTGRFTTLEEFANTFSECEREANQLRAETDAFHQSLPRRVPFVAPSDRPATHAAIPDHLRSHVSTGLSLDTIRHASIISSPVDLVALDRTVRSDSNRFCMQLAGDVQGLAESIDYLQLSALSRRLDLELHAASEVIHNAQEQSLKLQQSIAESTRRPMSIQELEDLSARTQQVKDEHTPPVLAVTDALRHHLRQLIEQTRRTEHPSVSGLLSKRQQSAQDTLARAEAWRDSLRALADRVSELCAAEEARLARQRAEEEEAERLRAEAVASAERERLEAEKRAIEAERRAAVEAERRAAEEAERRAAEEAKRRAAEEAERREAEEAERRAAEKAERRAAEKAERRAAEEAERRAAEEAERRAAEEAARLEREEAERRAVEERLAIEEAERQAKQEAERFAQEAQARARAEEERLALKRRAAEEAATHALAEEERNRLASERADSVPVSREKVKVEHNLVEHRFPTFNDTEDVFGMDGLPNEGSIMSPELSNLRQLIANIRKRLQAANIDGVAEANEHGSSDLPSEEHATKLDKSFVEILDEVNTLPQSVPESAAVDSDLRSLRADVQNASNLLRKVHQLANLASSIQRCDNALSDLLEHIDSYPAPPSGPLSSSYHTDTRLPPEDQISARLAFTKRLVEDANSQATTLASDPRAQAERQRIAQTWEELRAMGSDCVAGHTSRPPSTISNGRVSRNAPTPGPIPGPKRPSLGGRSSLGGRPSISGSSSQPQFLAPPLPRAQRSVSGGSTPRIPSRASSRASNTSTQRSVSGPITVPVTSSRLYQPTFASRQRTNSSASEVSTPIGKTPVGRRALSPIPPTPQSFTTRPRAKTNQNMPSRVASPAFSELSHSRSGLHASRSSTGSVARSTWSRAPRQSFPGIPKPSPPGPKSFKETERRPYVPNPKNKLDVAVGDVVNNLPINISIEVVAETWKDQSGKYWIGDEDPKLCFCRILRSQTVMVRVGGGWTELSKFIKEHFADAFRLLPESPPRVGTREERWISSATLQQSSIQEVLSPPLHPTTPEPNASYIPPFTLSTPSGSSPKSVKSSSPGSPLQPIQFIRRADRESPMLRSDTPTKMRSNSVTHSSRQPAWRP